MNNKSLWILLGFVFLFFLGAIFYNSYKVNKEEADSLRQEIINQENSRPETTVNVKHQYTNGLHSFVGTIELPNPCYTYNAIVNKKENGDVEIALTTTAPTQTDLVCPMVITPKTFRVDFSAPETANVYATLNGELVNLNIFEIGPDEILEEVELYIKG